MFNGTPEDTNNFRRLLQENLKVFHDKIQVWKAKLQKCPEPEKVGHVMHGANNILASDLIYNVLKVVEKEMKLKIDILVQLEAAFHTDSEQEIFYKNYNNHDKEEHTALNHRKVPTTYCHPKYRNLLAVHLLSALSEDSDVKWLTSGYQQRFLPAPGACIAFDPKGTFAAYLADTGWISAIQETAYPIEYIQTTQFNAPLTTDDPAPLVYFTL